MTFQQTMTANVNKDAMCKKKKKKDQEDLRKQAMQCNARDNRIFMALNSR